MIAPKTRPAPDAIPLNRRGGAADRKPAPEHPALETYERAPRSERDNPDDPLSPTERTPPD